MSLYAQTITTSRFRFFHPETIANDFCLKMNWPRHSLLRFADALDGFSRSASRYMQPDSLQIMQNGSLATYSSAATSSAPNHECWLINTLEANLNPWHTVASDLQQALNHIVQSPNLVLKTRHCAITDIPGLLYEQDSFREQVIIILLTDSHQWLGRRKLDVAKYLARWPHCVCLEPRFPTLSRQADKRQQQLQRLGLALFPLSAQGLVQAGRFLCQENRGKAVAYKPMQQRDESRLSVRIESILGPTLQWVQACAMLPPPCALGLAEKIRQQFFSSLLSENAFFRLFSLPEVSYQATISGSMFYFSPHILAILRAGFARHTQEKQAQILQFLEQQVAQQAPENTPENNKAYQEWQWYEQRLQLEIEPDSALKNIQQLAKIPELNTMIMQDLATVSLPDNRACALYNQIPLRRAPQSRKALAYLQQWSEDTGVTDAQLHPWRFRGLNWLDKLYYLYHKALMVANFSPDGQWILSGDIDNAASLWHVHNRQEHNLVDTDWYQPFAQADKPWLHKPWGNARSTRLIVDFSADSQRMVTALGDNIVRVWETSSRQPVYIFKDHGLSLRALLFVPDSEQLLGVSAEGQIWDIAKGQWLYTLTGHSRLIQHAALSADGLWLATVTTDGCLRVWHSRSGEPVLTVSQAHQGAIQSVAFNYDGSLLATASVDHSAKIWQFNDGQCRHHLQGHKAAVNDARFSPDGKWLVTASDDHTCCLWSCEDGILKQVLKNHQGIVNTAQFSPDGQQILSAGNDRTIQTYHCNLRL
ncbi:WD40 repeat domain-containing protein [Candidatus Venteria ishoeyi]|uniref:WD40 repeat domain-containing protein n=1 Tax=Candidatus Venteria ishoeyi TaxID=1899563 RepID=UPI0025A55C74|nr:WD40 repeat domain-containing protein [Candidatus Venteria ishoeyi]MDM8548035.1 WD40 repeat domain-containing protein [Candidatus Venteria ishoeyi]